MLAGRAMMPGLEGILAHPSKSNVRPGFLRRCIVPSDPGPGRSPGRGHFPYRTIGQFRRPEGQP